jgi:D-galacturonate reductase
MDSMSPGDVCIIFTPDDTHFKITMAAIEHKLHVLVAKPVVKTLAEHLKLMEAAKQHSVLVRPLR